MSMQCDFCGDHPDTDLTDPHGEAEALRRENARLRETNKTLHRRAQVAESEAYKKAGRWHRKMMKSLYWQGIWQKEARQEHANAKAAIARAEAAEAALAASRAPDPVANAGSCQPMDTIDSLFDQIRAIMDAAKDQADRYGHIAATIYVNALRHGATSADADAMVRGEINFISWMADVIEKRDRALPPAPQPTIGGAELDALRIWKLANMRDADDPEYVSAIADLRAQPDWKAQYDTAMQALAQAQNMIDGWKAMAERLGEAARTLDDHYERHICYHDSVHRGGSIWTICDDCGAKWADDRGGFKPFEHPEDVVKARAALSDLAKMKGNEGWVKS